jgi:hypothetical protein
MAMLSLPQKRDALVLKYTLQHPRMGAPTVLLGCAKVLIADAFRINRQTLSLAISTVFQANLSSKNLHTMTFQEDGDGYQRLPRRRYA